MLCWPCRYRVSNLLGVKEETKESKCTGRTPGTRLRSGGVTTKSSPHQCGTQDSRGSVGCRVGVAQSSRRGTVTELTKGSEALLDQGYSSEGEWVKGRGRQQSILVKALLSSCPQSDLIRSACFRLCCLSFMFPAFEAPGSRGVGPRTSVSVSV